MTKLKSKRRAMPEPFLSKTPWEGFARGDHPRAQPLASCPDARCRRSKECHAAHGGLFCQRTHFSGREQARLDIKERQALDSIFPPLIHDLPAQMRLAFLKLRHAHMAKERDVRNEELTARWKAGVLDHLYGKWRAKGALMQPPPREYREGRS